MMAAGLLQRRSRDSSSNSGISANSGGHFGVEQRQNERRSGRAINKAAPLTFAQTRASAQFSAEPGIYQ